MEVPETDFRRQEASHPIPLENCALVLLDVWDRHHIATHQNRCESVISRVISPLLATARCAGLAVIHAPGSPIAALHGATPEENRWSGEAPPADWPPQKFRNTMGEYSWLSASVAEPAVMQLREDRRIHPAVLPVEGEPVVAGIQGLKAVLEERRILFVFFAGFAANVCMLYRDYGMRAVRGLGYHVVLLRDATAAIEIEETLSAKRLLQSAVDEVEFNLGWTARSTDLTSALSATIAPPPEPDSGSESVNPPE